MADVKSENSQPSQNFLKPFCVQHYGKRVLKSFASKRISAE
jgi:hypothetical protein